MWSVGCLFYELFHPGEALFKGNSQIGTLLKICKVVGTPTEETCPTLKDLEIFKENAPNLPKWPGMEVDDVMPMLGEDGLDLFCQMLSFDPCFRISAEKALLHVTTSF